MHNALALTEMEPLLRHRASWEMRCGCLLLPGETAPWRIAMTTHGGIEMPWNGHDHPMPSWCSEEWYEGTGAAFRHRPFAWLRRPWRRHA